MALPLLAVVPGLFAWLSSAVAKTILDRILMFLALKAVLTFLFIIIVPIVLNNLLFDLMETMMNLADTAAGTGGPDGSMTFTGITAWMIDCFKLKECLAVLTSAMQLRLALSMIPFVGFKG